MAQDYTLLIGVKLDKSQLDKDLTQISKTQQIDLKVKAETNDLEKAKVTTTKYKNEVGQTITVVEKFNTTLNENETIITKVSTKTNTANTSLKSLGKEFLETTGKVAKFGASTAVIGMFYEAINMAKEAVFDFDSALTEFRKVSSLSEEQLSSYTEKLGEMGKEVARTRKYVRDCIEICNKNIPKTSNS